MLALVVRVFRMKRLLLIVDDTLVRRSGKKVALGYMHHDPPLKSGGRAFFSYGHLFVVLVADPLYAGRGFVHAVRQLSPRVHVIARGRPDAALWRLPPPRRPGQRGRPRSSRGVAPSQSSLAPRPLRASERRQQATTLALLEARSKPRIEKGQSRD